VTILVDRAIWNWRGRKWAHLVSDESYDELHAFAARLDIPRRAFQGDHYDVPDDYRERAIVLGAEPVEGRILVQRLRAAGLRKPRHPHPAPELGDTDRPPSGGSAVPTMPPAPTPDLPSLLHLIDEETRRFAGIARKTPLDERSRTYPAFTAEELIAHMGRNLRDSQATLTTRRLPDPAHPVPAPAGPAVIDFFEEGIEPVLDAYRASPLDFMVESYGGPQPAFALVNSLAIEAALHRWDLGTIVGDDHPIDARLAAVCFDTVLIGFLPRLAAMPFGVYLGGQVLFRATDTGDRWLFDVVDDKLVGRRVGGDEGDDADTVVEGTVSDLLLVLFKRKGPCAPGVTVHGDDAVVERLLLLGYVPDPRTTSAH
jgi:hypothetical protein